MTARSAPVGHLIASWAWSQLVQESKQLNRATVKAR